jgi:hypothetical protein
VRRVRVGNVSSVSAAAFSVDWLLTAVEAAHYGHGGILPYVLRQLLRADESHSETPQEGDVRCRTWPSMD